MLAPLFSRAAAGPLVSVAWRLRINRHEVFRACGFSACGLKASFAISPENLCLNAAGRAASIPFYVVEVAELLPNSGISTHISLGTPWTRRV